MLKFEDSYTIVANWFSDLDEECFEMLGRIHTMNIQYSEMEAGNNLKEILKLRDKTIVDAIKMLDRVVVLTNMINHHGEA